MKWLGHRNSAMVRHYFHLNDHEARQHMQRLSLDDETKRDDARPAASAAGRRTFSLTLVPESGERRAVAERGAGD